MRRSLLAATLAAPLALGLTSGAGPQGQQDFALVNQTGYQINEVYFGPSTSRSWGRDLLGSGVLPSGNRFNINFPRSTSECRWDIKVVYDDRDESEFMRVNLCCVSTVTLFWNRQAGTTRAVTE